eukprot:scaffold131968_cov42-Phaeocystis_antarctica.AAC.2
MGTTRHPLQLALLAPCHLTILLSCYRYLATLPPCYLTTLLPCYFLGFVTDGASSRLTFGHDGRHPAF